MAELVARIDGLYISLITRSALTHHHEAPLATHLESESVEFMQFAFRWMNCLLMREISVRNTIRMWDTYLVCFSHLAFVLQRSPSPQSEGAEAFSQFHLYVCSAFLVRWSDKLRTMDFQVGHFRCSVGIQIKT
jgi:hypothetical protein